MKIILRWIFTPARPFQFWMPMSGPVGGLILGGILIVGLLARF